MRSDALAAAASYPAITVTVNAAAAAYCVPRWFANSDRASAGRRASVANHGLAAVVWILLIAFTI